MYIELASLPDCTGGDCPKIIRDPITGMIGVRGSVAPGSKDEHVSWMSPEDYRTLTAQITL